MGQDNAPKSSSRVNLDHFDPEGVRELSRTLSQSTTDPTRRSLRSDKTLETEEPFSLERTLRAVIDKCVPVRFTLIIDRVVLQPFK